ncbi:MAG: phage tail tube protein [Pseudomonadota bacterium]|jgi:hypothetical protein|uniref:hypothetical protein n=1 Tax=Sphingobium yanoikuyae TaxID=13690 RepID=UPI00310DCCEB
MANGAMLARKTRLEVKDGENWIQVKGFKDFSGLGGGSAAVVDVSDLDSDAKEKLIGLPDEGQISISLNYIESDPGQQFLEEARLSGELIDARIVLRNNNGFAYSAAVLTFEKSGGVDAVLAGTVGMEISGLVTKVTVTP